MPVFRIECVKRAPTDGSTTGSEHIEFLGVRNENGQPDVLRRQEVIDLIFERRVAFVVETNGARHSVIVDPYLEPAPGHNLSGQTTHYLKTHPDKTPGDNLGDLPECDRLAEYRPILAAMMNP